MRAHCATSSSSVTVTFRSFRLIKFPRFVELFPFRYTVMM
jgi:hypothetical protein